MLPKPLTQSRYEIVAKIASGGMATVYLGVLKGPYGFEQLVAIKRLHPHLLDEPSSRESFLMEARMAARIRHANVVDVRDIEIIDETVQLIMPYIEGASLGSLIVTATQRKSKIPPSVVIRIMLDACAGLHAAHELKDAAGKPLGLVHRDISPQNVLVGVDGIARITDFGVARDESSNRLRTSTGLLKGKFAYMSPEYINGKRPDRRLDVFALGVVLWEALAGRRLFRGSNDGETLSRVTSVEVPRIGHMVPELGDELDAVLEMALSKAPETRFCTAQALGAALEAIAAPANMIAPVAEVSRYVRETAREDLGRLEELRRSALSKSGTHEKVPHTETTAMSTTPTMPQAGQRTAQHFDTANDKTNIVPILDLAHAPQSALIARILDGEGEMDRHADTEAQSSVVHSVSAERMPAPSFPPTLKRPAGPRGTTLMAPVHNVQVVAAAPLSLAGGSSASAAAEAAAPPKTAARNEMGVSTLPIAFQRIARPVLPFKTEKSSLKRALRNRWVLAAGVLFLLLGIGTTLWMVPRSGARNVNAAESEAK
ncbi:MAG: serine/threonine protein kinase [Polyangiaceae bacterium]|nr:serine/threonine protein kinase [Polyangiaceae bacterium]